MRRGRTDGRTDGRKGRRETEVGPTPARLNSVHINHVSLIAQHTSEMFTNTQEAQGERWNNGRARYKEGSGRERVGEGGSECETEREQDEGRLVEEGNIWLIVEEPFSGKQ